MEEWKEWKEGIYVSNTGRVIRDTAKNGKGFNPYELDIKTKGYRRITYKNKQYRVAIIVGELFIPNPENLPVIDHISRNTYDDIISNLRWTDKRLNGINTGYKKNNKLKEKYIHYREDRKAYIVQSNRKAKQFKTLKEAIDYRNSLIDNKSMIL